MNEFYKGNTDLDYQIIPPGDELKQLLEDERYQLATNYNNISWIASGAAGTFLGSGRILTAAVAGVLAIAAHRAAKRILEGEDND